MPLPAFGGHFDVQAATQVIGRGAAVFDELFRRTRPHHVSAMPPRARTDVENVVRFEHHVFVVFHHQNGVAQVAQVLQRVDQFHVIALMQPNAWLVHDVEHPNELRTNLRGQPDALRFAPGQCPQRPVEGEVVQTNIHQKADALTNLFQHLFPDHVLPVGQACL